MQAIAFPSFRRTALTISFLISLYPFSVDGLGVNYVFLLLPAFFIALDGRLRVPPKRYLYLMVLYTVIFLVALLYQRDLYEHAGRRTISFVLYMSMFAFMFIKIDREMIASFKDALVLMSAALSAVSVLIFFAADTASLDLEPAKNLVGSQRVGFIYLFALWLTYADESPAAGRGIARYALLIVILAGLLLTFSRTSIVALVLSAALFAFVGSLKWLRRPRLGALWVGLLVLGGVVILILLLHTALPLVFDFFQQRLVDYALQPETITGDLENPQSSVGTRAYLLRAIVDFALLAPLLGSGYLGVWVAFGDLAGSAHSQYLDVLFRTGLAGFAAYVYLLILIAQYLYRRERALFWGFIAVLVYGLFHETFKESHGAFILAFMLGMISQPPQALLR